MYNTGNPVGSANPKDLFDNSEAFDQGMNGSATTFQNRLGQTQFSWAAFNQMTINALAQVGVTISNAQAAVNAAGNAGVAAINTAKNGALEDISGKVSEVEQSKTTAIEGIDGLVDDVDQAKVNALLAMAVAVSSLSDDLGNKGFDLKSQMLAYTPKFDGTLAWVQLDPIAENNGFWQYRQALSTWVKPAIQPVLSDAFELFRKSVSLRKRPRGPISGNAPLIIGAAGVQILYAAHQKLPRGRSGFTGTVPVVGNTPILPMVTLKRPRSRAFPQSVLLMSGRSVMLTSDGSVTPVIPVVIYDAKKIADQSQGPASKRYAAIVSGQVWGYDPEGGAQLTVPATGTWLAAQACAFDIVRALRANPADASKPQPHSITKDGRIFRDGKVLLHKLVTGQSLALGSRGIIPSPAGEYVIQGVRGNLLSPFTPAGYTDKLWTLTGGPRPSSWEGTTAFEPVREYVAGVLGETPATSYMLAMRKWHERSTSILPQMLYSISALGGTAYAGLKKGTTTYTNAISQVNTAKAIATLMNLDYSVPSVSITHGESQSGTTRSEYVAYQTEWGTDYRTDIVAITGQAVPPIIMITQMLTGDPGVAMAGIPLAQMDVCETVPWFVMVGPKYWLPYFDTYHGLAEMYVKMGELEARAERLTQTVGKWQPLKVLSATVSGVTITLRLNNLPNGNSGTPGPIGKLVADTTAVSDPGSLGFMLSAGTIETVAVGRDGASVIITATAAIAAGTTLTYALQPTLNSPQNGNGRRGCIRDTDLRDFSRFDNAPLYNWLCAFSLNLEI